VIIDLEAFPLPDLRDGIRFQAEVELHDAMTPGACQVVVVMIALAKAKGVRPVGELYAVEDLHPHQLVDGPIDGGPTDARVGPVKLLQEVFRGKRCSGMPEAYQVFRDGLAGLCPPLPKLLERLVDPFLDVH